MSKVNVEQRIVRLKIVNRTINIDCPYQRRSVPAEVCFIGQRSPTHPFCFRCPDGAVFESQLKARTFNRVVAPMEASEGSRTALRVKVSKKKRGVDFTYAHYIKEKNELTMPMYETIVHGTFLSSREHHGLMSESDLSSLALQAERERKNMRSSGMYHGKAAKSGGKKKMIGKEMQGLIEDKKRRDEIKPSPGGWFADFSAKEALKNAQAKTPQVAVKTSSFMRGKPKNRSPLTTSFKPKKVQAMPTSASSLIQNEARRLTKRRS